MYAYQVYVPRDYQALEPLPVILFLHGAGERGTDGIYQTTVGLPAAIREESDRFPAIVVMPQSQITNLTQTCSTRSCLAWGTMLGTTPTVIMK